MKAHLFLVIFLIFTITINYILDFEDSVLDKYFKKPSGILYYTLFYYFAYYLIAIPNAWIRKTDYLKKKEFWIKSLLFVGIIGIMAGFYQYYEILKLFKQHDEYFFVRKILINAKRIIPYVLLLFVVKLFYDKKEKGLYGLKLKGTNFSPYFILLLFVLPLILYASFQQDFLEAYPRWPYWNAKETFGLSRPVMALIYETFYGLDFLSVELIFRGALVIGMVKIMGKDAILPMVAVYAFLHFGKPLGERISSVFGGYILGVIALYSRSILGGFILHVGVAYMMEIAAYIQHFLMIKNH